MKRSRENQPEPTSNKRQTTLLSMFKPVAAPVITAPKVADSSATTEEKALDVPVTTASAKQRNPKNLFKNVDPETLELLDLEITTMNYEWLKVLAPELTKPYFLKLKRYLKAELAAKKTIFPPCEFCVYITCSREYHLIYMFGK